MQHSIDCKLPEQIRAVYLVDSDTNDFDIVNANIDEEIISLEQSETDEFEYKMSAHIKTISSNYGNPNEDRSYKIVIHTNKRMGLMPSISQAVWKFLPQ
jgi:hypothetical protein